MKLLYIVNSRIPTEKAHGIQIMKMCEAFSNLKNVEVELVVPWRFNAIKKDPFEYYDIERNFKIKRLPALDLIPLSRYIGRAAFWANAFSFLFFVIFYILFRKPDIIYTRGKPILFLSLFKKNIIFEAHGALRDFFIPFLKKSKRTIVITNQLKEYFIQKGISANKILVAADSVDLEKFKIRETREECRKKLNLPLNKKIVLYTGHLYRWKGADILAQASVYLPEGVEVYFVGGTEKDIKKFKFQVSNLKLKNVLVVGHRPHAEIPFWFKAADILVLPSSAKEPREKYYTSPLKLFEYMASKRPILASDLPSIKEIVNPNNALLVTPDNSEEFAKGIKELLKNPDFSAKISNQAFQDIQPYTWQERAKKIISFNFLLLSVES